MANFLILANWLLPMLYLGLLIDYGAAFYLRTPRPGRNLWLPAVLGLHVLFLVLLGIHLGRIVPVSSFEVLSVLAASTVGAYWVVELASAERRTGVFVLLAAFLMQYTATVFLPGADLNPAATGAGGKAAGFHIIPSIVAYTALTISAVHGLLYLLARRDLKQRRLGLLFDRLPSLDALGRMNWHASLVGFAFMTLAIASGAVMYAGGGHKMPDGLDTKVWMKMLAGTTAWVVYAAAVAGHWIGRWSPARVSMVTVLGFLVVVAMLVASIVLS